MDAKSWGMLTLFALGTLVLGTASGLSSLRTSQAYGELEAPSWAPPGWLFGPVWTVLYLMIGTAGWLVWQQSGWGWPLGLWGIQLGLNLAWTPLFFGLGLRGLALIDITLLLGVLVATIVAFAPISSLAAWLLVPYGAWVCFATILNAAFWWMNR